MSKITLKHYQKTIPTYVPGKPSTFPMFFENKPYQGASGRLYPIPYSDVISDEKTDVEYEVYDLENEFVKTEIAPALGGKIMYGYDKMNNYTFIYHNEVVKPALVGLAGPWISGGIEFNWPQHHRPTTFMPLEAKAEETETGTTVWVGEVEPFERMKGMAGITLDKGRSYIKAKIRVYNRTALPQRFMWWANLAVPVNNQYQTVFPQDVEWINDHDRRAVLSWPVAKGTFHTARPFNYGEGVDISKYDAIKVPSSYLVSQGQSDMDFLSGYDFGKQAGIVTTANHHIAPGKKMWTWGKGDFGEMWCSNLTDENGPYIELMTGVYTDNQPDFTWIAPYETREFEQYWYPIREIGEVKNASIDAAMNFEKRGEKAFLGLIVTGTFRNAKIVVKNGAREVFSEIRDLDPSVPYLNEIDLKGEKFDEMTAYLFDEEGKLLVSYQKYQRGQKQPIEVRQPVKRPSEIDNLEELYLNGLHLEQYKQHNYDPRDYYAEGLRRDPDDSRCNTGLARIALRNGEFEKCISHADRAIRRLTLRNQHPTDTEAFYLKGLALRYLERYGEAYDTLYKASWNYAHRSAAYYELATLDCRNGDYENALSKLSISLEGNSKNTKAINLKTAILRKLGFEKASENAKKSYEDDALDFFAKVEYSHFSDVKEEISEFTKKAENVLDVARDYMECGLYEDAIHALSLFKGESPLVEYYLAYCLAKCGAEQKMVDAELSKAEALDTGYCFPASLADIAVLRFAEKGAKADYYLGCLFYDRFRYAEAAECWEQSLSKDETNGKAWRNLALYYFDKAKKGEKARTCLENALRFSPDEPRLLMEYEQLLKNMNCTIQERLSVYDEYPELLKKRDDCYLDKLTLISELGDYETAIRMAAVKRFHIYEGGEGKLTKQHAWMHVLYALQLMKEGQNGKAEKILQNGINMPKSYGEAKTFFNQEAHIYYLLSKLVPEEKRKETLEKAAEYKAAVSELSLFRAIALKKLGDTETASMVLDEMMANAQKTIDNADMRTYYGVGSPSLMPFEYDIVKNNTRDGHILKAYALLGEGRCEEAKAVLETARKLDPNDFRIYAFDQVFDFVRQELS